MNYKEIMIYEGNKYQFSSYNLSDVVTLCSVMTIVTGIKWNYREVGK